MPPENMAQFFVMVLSPGQDMAGCWGMGGYPLKTRRVPAPHIQAQDTRPDGARLRWNSAPLLAA